MTVFRTVKFGFYKFLSSSSHFSLLSVHSRLLPVWRDSIIFLFTFLFTLQPARSHTPVPPQIQFQLLLLFLLLPVQTLASPSYHLSRPAHVSVVREVSAGQSQPNFALPHNSFLTLLLKKTKRQKDRKTGTKKCQGCPTLHHHLREPFKNYLADRVF